MAPQGQQPVSDAGRTTLRAAGSRRPRRLLPWVLWGLGAAIVLVGMLGADRAFYERVSRHLNTEGNPYDRDFYTSTLPLWTICRYAFAHVYGLLVIYFLVLAWHPRGWRAANAWLAGVVAAALVANVAQGAIGRLRPNQAPSHLAFARPFTTLLNKENVSFPSGEAATAFALACGLARLLPRAKAAFYAAAALTAAARLVNGAHYPSDVAAGAMLGVLVGGAVFDFVDRRHDHWVARLRRRGAGTRAAGGETAGPEDGTSAP